MGELAAPESPELLYASWGEPPSIARPIMQGDVFTDITLPGLGGQPQLAQVVMHPCNMRKGSVLRELITMIPVSEYSMSPTDWRKRFRIMPLPSLHGENSLDCMADMIYFSSVPAIELDPTKRVAALSDGGVLILQQRLVFTQTRLLLGLDKYHEQMAPTFIELELQEDWVEAALSVDDSDPDDTTAVDEAVKQYQAWLDEDDEKRRKALAVSREHSRLRREAREQIASLYSEAI